MTHFNRIHFEPPLLEELELSIRNKLYRISSYFPLLLVILLYFATLKPHLFIFNRKNRQVPSKNWKVPGVCLKLISTSLYGISEVGFPIVVTLYLLYRIESKLDMVVQSIQGLPERLKGND